MIKKKTKEMQDRARAYEQGFALGVQQGKEEILESGLRLPKSTLVLYNEEKKEIVAINGRWNRAPEDCEILKAYHKTTHQQFKDL